MAGKQSLFIFIILFLFGVLSFQLYFLFVKQSPKTPQRLVEDTATQNNLNNLYVKMPEKTVQVITDGINQKAESLKPLLRSGVLKQLEMTENYKSIIIKNGKTSTERTIIDGSSVKADYLISFATMSEDGKKDFGYLFSERDLERIEAYRLQGEEEIEISLEQIQPGDFVSITMVTSLTTHPEDSLISFKIVKLL